MNYVDFLASGTGGDCQLVEAIGLSRAEEVSGTSPETATESPRPLGPHGPLATTGVGGSISRFTFFHAERRTCPPR